MATMITEECINCGACEPECPNTAIYQGGVEWDGLDGAKHPALTDQFFYIVPEKCTECVGFYDHEACAAVCPVDCCVPNPQIPETEAVLLARARTIHPDKAIPDDAPSRFKKDGAAPAGDGAAPAAAPAAAAAAPIAAKAVAAAPAPRIGKVEKKVAAPLQQPTPRTAPYSGELPVDFEEALAVVRPAGGTSKLGRLEKVALTLGQPILGALPARTKARLEAAVGNPRVFSAAGATGFNMIAHVVILPILATAFAVKWTGESLYSEAVRPWFFWGGALAVLESIVRVREAVLFARPTSEVVYRGSIYGVVLVPFVAWLLRRLEAGRDSGSVSVEGYYRTDGAFDEKKERERRYGEVFTVEEHPGGYVFHLELPRRIPPSGVKEQLGLGDEMPDYALELKLAGTWFEVHGKVVDPRLRTVAASAPAFPPDFTTRIPLREHCTGFAYRHRDKNLDVAIVKPSAVGQLLIPAHAA
jgi:ferredoxin